MRQSKVRLRGRHTLQPEALATACTEIRAYDRSAFLEYGICDHCGRSRRIAVYPGRAMRAYISSFGTFG